MSGNLTGCTDDLTRWGKVFVIRSSVQKVFPTSGNQLPSDPAENINETPDIIIVIEHLGHLPRRDGVKRTLVIPCFFKNFSSSKGS